MDERLRNAVVAFNNGMFDAAIAMSLIVIAEHLTTERGCDHEDAVRRPRDEVED